MSAVRRRLSFRLVDPLAVLLVLLGVGLLLRDDLVEPGPSSTRIAARRGERAPRIERPQLDELTRADIDRAQESARAGERHVAAYPDRLAPCAQDATGPGHGRRQATERLLPLVAPDLQVDVDDVVVADRQPAEAVADRERARLIASLEPPDDPHPSAEVGDAERARRPARLELGRRARAERAAVLEDDDVRDPLAPPVAGSHGSRT